MIIAQRVNKKYKKTLNLMAATPCPWRPLATMASLREGRRARSSQSLSFHTPLHSHSGLRTRDALPPTRKRYASARPAPARDARRRVRALPSPPPPRPRTATKWAAHRRRARLRCAQSAGAIFSSSAHRRRRARRDRRWAQRVATGWRAGSRPTRGRRTVAKGCAAELMAETIAETILRNLLPRAHRRRRARSGPRSQRRRR